MAATASRESERLVGSGKQKQATFTASLCPRGKILSLRSRQDLNPTVRNKQVNPSTFRDPLTYLGRS
jgi:hypothetical protein